MKNLLLLPFCLLLMFSLQAQDEPATEADPDNMIVNSSFDNFEGKLKKAKQFDLVKDWKPGNSVMPDLYARDIKSDYVAIPNNMYGVQEPHSGDTYAGIVAYGYRGRIPRSYISTRMKTDMVKGQMYCIKFRASLAELSKYAVNNLGVHFTKHETNVQTENSLLFDERIVTDDNPVVTEMEGWHLYCKIVQGKGFERYMTIGNFDSDEKTKAEKVKRPTGMTQMQENMAYYYIDDVSVKKIQYPGECDCSEGRIPESKIIYSKTSTTLEGKTLSEQAAASTIYFYQFNPEVTSSFHKDLDNLVNILKENKLVRLKIISHIDNEEADMASKTPRLSNLCEQRAIEVLKYFQHNGIDRSRLIMEMKENDQPDSEMNTPLSLAKNRRVEFQITK